MRFIGDLFYHPHWSSSVSIFISVYSFVFPACFATVYSLPLRRTHKHKLVLCVARMCRSCITPCLICITPSPPLRFLFFCCRPLLVSLTACFLFFTTPKSPVTSPFLFSESFAAVCPSPRMSACCPSQDESSCKCRAAAALLRGSVSMLHRLLYIPIIIIYTCVFQLFVSMSMYKFRNQRTQDG